MTPISLLYSSEVYHMALSLLGFATCSILDQGLNGTSNMRIAIAAWEKGASWRAQGWAGEKGDRTDRAM